METPRALATDWGNYGRVGDGDVSRRTFLGPDHVLLPRYMHSTLLFYFKMFWYYVPSIQHFNALKLNTMEYYSV